jgi:predicted nuclease of predicted toxin-antitoxin system
MQFRYLKWPEKLLVFMKLLFDECVPKKLKRAIMEHEVLTVSEMSWRGVKNGKLLALAASEFDVFITVDQNMGYQQNLDLLPLPIIVLEATSNRLKDLLPLVEKLKTELQLLKPKTYVVVRL